MKRIAKKGSPRKDYVQLSFVSIYLLSVLLLCLVLQQSCVPMGAAPIGALPEKRTIEYEYVSSSKVVSDGDESIVVLCFDDDEKGLLDTFSIVGKGTGKAEFACRAGRKRVVMISGTNDRRQTEVVSYSDLLKLRSRLSDDTTPGGIACGETVMESGQKGCRIQLKPLKSRVGLSSIRSDFTIDNAQWYLTNISGECPYVGGDYYRVTDLIPRSEIREIGRTGISTKYLTEQVECYPDKYSDVLNGPTRLVIRGEVGDTTFFWPVTIGAGSETGVERNAEYNYNIHITQRGTLSEDQQMWTGKPWARLFPGQIASGYRGETLEFRVECNPDWAEVNFDIEDLEYDVSRGIYSYDISRDGKEISLHLENRGTGMFIIDVGYPVNESYLVLVICEP